MGTTSSRPPSFYLARGSNLPDWPLLFPVLFEESHDSIAVFGSSNVNFQPVQVQLKDNQSDNDISQLTQSDQSSFNQQAKQVKKSMQNGSTGPPSQSVSGPQQQAIVPQYNVPLSEVTRLFICSDSGPGSQSSISSSQTVNQYNTANTNSTANQVPQTSKGGPPSSNTSTVTASLTTGPLSSLVASTLGRQYQYTTGAVRGLQLCGNKDSIGVVGIACHKGSKIYQPNQDNLFFIRRKFKATTSSSIICGVFDGHGPVGEVFSELAARWAPLLLLRDSRFGVMERKMVEIEKEIDNRIMELQQQSLNQNLKKKVQQGTVKSVTDLISLSSASAASTTATVNQDMSASSSSSSSSASSDQLGNSSSSSSSSDSKSKSQNQQSSILNLDKDKTVAKIQTQSQNQTVAQQVASNTSSSNVSTDLENAQEQSSSTEDIATDLENAEQQYIGSGNSSSAVVTQCNNSSAEGPGSSSYSTTCSDTDDNIQDSNDLNDNVNSKSSSIIDIPKVYTSQFYAVKDLSSVVYAEDDLMLSKNLSKSSNGSSGTSGGTVGTNLEETYNNNIKNQQQPQQSCKNKNQTSTEQLPPRAIVSAAIIKSASLAQTQSQSKSQQSQLKTNYLSPSCLEAPPASPQSPTKIQQSLNNNSFSPAPHPTDIAFSLRSVFQTLSRVATQRIADSDLKSQSTKLSMSGTTCVLCYGEGEIVEIEDDSGWYRKQPKASAGSRRSSKNASESSDKLNARESSDSISRDSSLNLSDIRLNQLLLMNMPPKIQKSPTPSIAKTSKRLLRIYRLTCAWLGDSRAIVVEVSKPSKPQQKDNQSQNYQLNNQLKLLGCRSLTKDHKPDNTNPNELKRLKQAWQAGLTRRGGLIRKSRVWYLCDDMSPVHGIGQKDAKGNFYVGGSSSSGPSVISSRDHKGQTSASQDCQQGTFNTQQSQQQSLESNGPQQIDIQQSQGNPSPTVPSAAAKMSSVHHHSAPVVNQESPKTQSGSARANVISHLAKSITQQTSSSSSQPSIFSSFVSSLNPISHIKSIVQNGSIAASSSTNTQSSSTKSQQSQSQTVGSILSGSVTKFSSNCTTNSNSSDNTSPKTLSGLNMSRSLGDRFAHRVGVSSEPDISELIIPIGEVTGDSNSEISESDSNFYVLLGSDGLFDVFNTNRNVAEKFVEEMNNVMNQQNQNESSQYLQLDPKLLIQTTVDRLAVRAAKLWTSNHKSKYCDDITVMAIQIPSGR